MRHMLLVTAAALALSACNQGSVSLTNASPEEVAAAVKDAGQSLSPGQWESTIEFTEVEMAGLPKVSGDALKARPDRLKTHSHCISAEEAANPSAGLWMGEDAKKSNCTVSKFSMKGGRIEQVFSCPNPDGKEGLVLTTTGDYTADSVKGTVDMNVAGFMRMKGNLTSRRVGECKPGSEKQ